jgi:hypothetical protein
MNKIAFFGASITQQKTGYVHCFKQLNPQYEINQFGYGSMYITDAGICYIDDVINSSPNYCFLDWFSPACYRPPEKIKEYLDAIIQKLFSINCQPIFLFFYRKDINNGWFYMFDYLKNYAHTYNINVIDLSKIENADDNLRDSIHTNELGAKNYGTLISNEFHKMQFRTTELSITPNCYSVVKSLECQIEAKEYLTLKSSGCSSIIGILQNIGPYTEHVEYTLDNKEYKIELKDKWSEQYEREVIKLNIDQFCGSITLEIPDNTKLVFKKIFYTGDNTELLGYK